MKEASVESWSAKGNIDFMVNSYKMAGFCERVLRLLSYTKECNLWQLRDHVSFFLSHLSAGNG